MPIKNIDKRWLAGFFDGEGNICITARKNRHGKRRWIFLNVSVANTRLDILRSIQTQHGGHLGIYNLGKRTQPCGSLHWSYAAARKMLRYLLPYLRLKKRQATIALQLKTHSRSKTERQQAAQLKVRERVRRFNHGQL